MNCYPNILQNVEGRLLLTQYPADEIQESPVVRVNEPRKRCSITPLGKKYVSLLVIKICAHTHPVVAFQISGMQRGRLAQPNGSMRISNRRKPAEIGEEYGPSGLAVQPPSHRREPVGR